MPYITVRTFDRTGNRRSCREAALLRWAGRPKWQTRLTVPVPEFVAFLHQFELQLRSGVTADVALRQLAEDAPEGALRTILSAVHTDVARGRPIHEACRVFSKQFPPQVATVIAAGEATARLPESIHALAEHLQQALELRRTARRALVYPVIVLVATSGLIVFLLGGVVPQFAAIFASLHLELPAITVALIAVSTAIREHVLILAIVTGLGCLGLAALIRSPRLRFLRDRLALRLPIMGEVVRHLATARFAAHCRLLHEAGIPLLQTLHTGAELMANAVLARQVLTARTQVAVGRPLHAALPKGHAFPSYVVPALRSGESTGQLAAALRHIEDYAASRARDRLATALALLEPVLLAGLTAIVGLIALSFFLPLFSLLGGVNRH